MTAAKDYLVADIGLADYGRKELTIAETEMPGLMAARAEYGEKKPLKGARITGSLHMTIQTGVLIETLVALGADVRWASCNIFSTQDHAAAAIAAAGIPVYAVKGETLEEYWTYTDKIFQWADGGLSNMILDDGGDATMYILLGARAEAGEDVLSKPESEEEEVLVAQIKKRMAASPGWFTKQRDAIKGVTEETTTGVQPPVPACSRKGPAALPGDQRERLGHQVEVRQQVRLQGIAGRRHPPRHRHDDGRQGRRRAAAMATWARARQPRWQGAGARVKVTESRPDLRAAGLRWTALKSCTLEDVVKTADIFITATGNKDVIRLDHMREMKDMAIVGNIGHFDNEIQVAVSSRTSSGTTSSRRST